ncbi:DNA polymerase [Natronomonas sp. F2-12]|uniref:DNA polymerase n=1 Tax=Natronomonas aquatica TaxID=2841590 RepID=A0A9R1D3S1_9EURY|nr:DNA polymerase domain-containing protein [Natronomonas aquatica]MCQ4332609.1 DNA polymerase [Natronomonas aquatica]
MEQGTLGEFAGSEAADGDRPAEEAAAVAGTERAGADADIVEVSDHRFPDATGETECSVTQVDYTVEGSGDDEYPVLHVFGRTPTPAGEDEPVHVRVHGFRPYFYTPIADLDIAVDAEEPLLASDVVDSRLDNDRLTGLETYGDLAAEGESTGEHADDELVVYESIRSESLVKVFGRTPRDVGQLRDRFEHYEADILFPNRLLIDKDITSGVRVPERRLEDGSLKVHHAEIEPVDLEAESRVHTLDIEVDDRQGFPEDGEQTIVCLTSHDSYRDEYVVWLYESPEGTQGPDVIEGYDPIGGTDLDIDVRGFDDEAEMLEDYVEYVETTDPDYLTGWNCLPADTKILMADGREREIKDLEVGDLVVGSDEQMSTVTEVTNKWRSKKQIYHFELADGTSLQTSGDHRTMVGDEETVGWKQGHDIEPGEYVLKPRKLRVDSPAIPTLAELIPDERQRFTEESVREFKEGLPYGAVSELAGTFGVSKGSLWNSQPTAWSLQRCETAADRYDVTLPDGGTVAKRTEKPLDRELTEHEMYLAGLVLTDGSMSTSDGVRFYNTLTELHDQFPRDSTLEPDGKGCYKQNVLDFAIMRAFNGLGIPFGNKNATDVDLSRIYRMPEAYIARFLAGAVDGDGNVASSVTIAAKNPTIGDWYTKLFRRLGIYAERNDNVVRIPDAERDVERFKKRVLPHMNHPEKTARAKALEGGKSGRSENIPYALFEAEIGSDTKRIGNDKKRRDINLKRHETLSEEWEEYVFVEVENIETIGTETTYDIETTTHNFIADGCLVHNCDDFDFPYMIDRIDRLANRHEGLDSDRLSRVNEVWDSGWGGPDIKGRVVFDLLYAYQRTQFSELDSYRLDAVGEEELGVGKERYPGDIGDLWEDDPERLIEYNLRDVELCVELDRKQEIVPFWEEVASFVGCKLEDATTPGDAVDMYVLHEIHGEFALPSKGQQESEDYEGGAVFEPISGVKEMVSVLDLKSLYPMCMVTINASPETKVDPDAYDGETYVAPNGTHFRKEPDGMIREMVDELLEEREEKKSLRNENDPGSDAYETYDRQQAAVKVIMNCFTPDTDVLTPSGIRNIRDLDIGDDVYSLDPETMEMEIKPVVETHEYPDYRGDLVDIETSKIDFSVTPNHRMLVRKNDKNGITEDTWGFVEAGDLYDYCHYELPHEWDFNHDDKLPDCIDLPATLEEHTDIQYTITDGSGKVAAKYGKPNVQRQISTDRFLELLAWYITEGNMYEAKTGNYRVQIAQEQAGERSDIEELIDSIVDYYHVTDRSVSFSSRPLGELLEGLCGSGSENKRIPELVFEGSKEQKELFLEVLIRGDGDRQVNSWRYTTKSKQLRDDVLRLCTHLGLSATYTSDSGVWRIYCSENGKNSFRMYRDGSRSTADDGVYCVTVEDNNTLIAGRNGKLHNISNSLYGVLGWDRFRLYDKEMGAAVTATGRDVIEFTEEAASELDKEVTYGDTDSVMLELGGDISKEKAIEQSFEIESHINDAYDEFAERLNASTHRFQIEFEKLYRRFFQAGKKKRYAGHIIWSEGKDVDDLDITGFEYKRSDIAPITKEVQKQVLEMIVTGADREDIKDYVHEVIQRVQRGDVSPSEIGIPGGIGKKLDNYDTDTAQVRGAKYANLLLGTNFASGSKPKRLYLKKVHPAFFRQIESERDLDPSRDPLYGEFKRDPDVICFEYDDQLPDAFEIDYEKMLEKTLKGPIARILEAVDISWDEVKSGQEQTGLGNFV